MKLCFLGIVLSLLCSCGNVGATSKHIAELHVITRDYTNEMSTKYGVKCSGSGGGMMEDIEEVYYAFHIQGEYDIPHARMLHLKLMNNLIDRMKAHEPIHKYIRTYPNIEKVVAIDLFFKDRNGRNYNYPKLGAVTSDHGIIEFASYYTDGRGWRTIKEETYQEAMEIVAKSYLLENGSDGLSPQGKDGERCPQDFK